MRGEAPLTVTLLTIETNPLGYNSLNIPLYRPSAYFSGLFDGEGCIRLVRSGRYYYPRVEIEMACLSVLETFQAEFGGSLRVKKHTLSHHKQVYCWQLAAREEVLRFLTIISPWLIEKRVQAHTMTDYLERIKALDSATIDHEAVFLQLKAQKRVE